MRIEDDVKLDYSDVLIRPKRSELISRRDVDLTKEYTFRNSRIRYKGVPIMAANMDTIGTFEMAKVLHRHGLFACIHKHYSFKDWCNTADDAGSSDYLKSCAVSTGTSDEDLDLVRQVLGSKLGVDYICLDVANGYTESFVRTVGALRRKYEDKVIIAGNVVTGEMTEELLLAGADIIKVGIGPGCFAPGQKVKTDRGLKNIEDINKGEKVLTHTGCYKTVTDTFKFDDKKTIVNVNGIKATPNHEFYVLHKKHQGVVTEDNIHQYAEWIEAKDLTKDYLLLKHKLKKTTGAF